MDEMLREALKKQLLAGAIKPPPKKWIESMEYQRRRKMLEDLAVEAGVAPPRFLHGEGRAFQIYSKAMWVLGIVIGVVVGAISLTQGHVGGLIASAAVIVSGIALLRGWI